jgi:hypothetical protein
MTTTIKYEMTVTNPAVVAPSTQFKFDIPTASQACRISGTIASGVQRTTASETAANPAAISGPVNKVSN